MEKLKRYNQWMLAIIATLVIVFGIVGLIALIASLTYNFGYPSRYSDNDDIILVDSKKSEDGEIDLMHHQYSAQLPKLIDSADQLYIIPIAHVKLETPSEYMDEWDEYSDSYELGFSSGYKGRSYYYNESGFNNLILKDYLNSTQEILFQESIYIKHYSSITINSKKYILIAASNKDTNEDLKLNRSDFSDLFIYDIAENKMSEFSLKDYSYSNYINIQNQSKLMAKFQYDTNSDKELDRKEDPFHLYEIDIQFMTIKRLLNELEEDVIRKNL